MTSRSKELGKHQTREHDGTGKVKPDFGSFIMPALPAGT
jgi:hypothetical protein